MLIQDSKNWHLESATMSGMCGPAMTKREIFKRSRGGIGRKEYYSKQSSWEELRD